MSQSYQFSYYHKNIAPKIQTPSHTSGYQSSDQISQSVQSLKQQLKQKQSLLAQLSARLQEQEKLLEEKQFAIRQKEIQLQYIHKENQELHEKIFQLNQRLNAERADIKTTIKQEVSMLKEEFNMMVKQNQSKSQRILQQKEREFKRKEEELKSMIRELSQKASSNNGSFYHDSSQPNLIKSKNIQDSFSSKRNDEFYDNEEEKPSTANSILKNSRGSYRSSQVNSNVLGSLRESKVEDNKNLGAVERSKGSSSVSSLLNFREGGSSQANSQVTGRFGGFVKTPITSKLSVRRLVQDREGSFRASSRPNIDEIISRSKKELNQRNKRLGMGQAPKNYPPLSSSSNSRLSSRRIQNLDSSQASIRQGVEQIEEKKKMDKLKEISSLKMKVNLLKNELKEEISFCQHKQ